ncbi:MAG: hypothetical protein J6A89_08545 [Clostridia bacterium]|nr:hypothetical protein [Clostridia bacterium]
MKLSIAKCPSCGASIELKNNRNITKCKFCNNTIVIEDVIINSIDDENEIEAHNKFCNKEYEQALKRYNEILRDDRKNVAVMYRAALCNYLLNTENAFNHNKLISKIKVAIHSANQTETDIEVEEFKSIICSDVALHTDDLLNKTKKDYQNSEKTADDYNLYNSRIISLREIIMYCITELFSDKLFQLAPYVNEDISTPELYILFLVKLITYNVELCKIIEYKTIKKGKVAFDKITIEDELRKLLVDEYDMYVEEIKKYSQNFDPPAIERKGIKKGIFNW